MRHLLSVLLFWGASAFAGLTTGNASSIQGVPVSATGPTTNQCLVSPDGASWAPGSCSAGSGTFVGPGSSTAGNLVSFADTSGNLGADSGVAANNVCLLTGNQTLAGTKTFSSTIVGSVNGNAATATALASNPTDCAANRYATTIAANGDLTCAQVSLSAGVTGVSPIANGGTNSSTSLNNNRMVQSSGGALVEASAITGSRAICSDSNGITVACGSTTTTEIGYVNGVSSAIQTQINTKLPTTGVGLVDEQTGFIESATDKTYVLDQSAAYAYTINTLIIATASGTTTAAVKINGTNVTGISAVSVSSTPATGTASAANSVSIGDKVTLVLSSSSSPVDLAFTLKYTR